MERRTEKSLLALLTNLGETATLPGELQMEMLSINLLMTRAVNAIGSVASSLLQGKVMAGRVDDSLV